MTCKSIGKLKEKAKTDDDSIKKKEYDQSTFKASTGYGGKYGVQNDRVDKVKYGNKLILFYWQTFGITYEFGGF